MEFSEGLLLLQGLAKNKKARQKIYRTKNVNKAIAYLNNVVQ